MGVDVKKEWQKNIRKVEPYVPGDQPKVRGIIKLNTNENPYPPSPKMIRRAQELDNQRLNLYPDMDSKELIQALAACYQVNSNQVFVGVGSDDVLAMSFLTFFNSEKPILFPDITYSFYDVWAKLFQIPYEQPMLDGDFQIRKEDFYKENGGIILANPNAPTSISVSRDVIREIMNHNTDSIVIVDEAYVDFGGESVLELVSEYDNLLVVRTFSKSRSMAGMRIGFAIGDPYLIACLHAVKNSYNSYTMSMPSILLGAEAVKDETYFKEVLKKIINTREKTKIKMLNMGFHVLNSQTNFLFASHSEVPAAALTDMLKNKKIYIRYFNKPRIENFIRVTIGTEEEMDCFCKEIEDCIELLKKNENFIDKCLKL